MTPPAERGLVAEPAGQPGHETLTLSAGWQTACCAPLGALDAERLDGAYLDRLSWLPARVPGTAAAALRDAGLWQVGEPHDFDAEDWWFRTSFDASPAAPGEVVLRLDGIATVAEVYLNGERLLESDSMFAAHALPVGDRLQERNELVIRCRALAPLLAETRRPRARWRTRLVRERNLRFYRTMLLGRAPGFAPGPAIVGPWRPVTLKRQTQLVVEKLTLRPRIEGDAGVLSVDARLRPLRGTRLDSVEIELNGPDGKHSTELALEAYGRPGLDAHGRPSVGHGQLGASEQGPQGAGTTIGDELVAAGELTVPAVERWWPHTHGDAVLYDVRLLVAQVTDETAVTQATAAPTATQATAAPAALQTNTVREQLVIDAGRVGFRELASGATSAHEVLRDGIDLHVNGVRVFARGAVWTPLDLVEMAPSESDLHTALTQAREAGMNMLRLPGTGAYETQAFYDLCDELGIMVWQDFMFANFDYPIALESFRASVTHEATGVLDALGGRPSLAVVCGNCEVEQQVAMLGLDPTLGRGELFGELLPSLVRESGVDAIYVPSAPCGGDLPFRPDRGIANYYGVGGYRRPLEDARHAGVRFAAECLAFSNVPSGAYAEETGVPQDEGADWDFKDVRDHYLGMLFDLDPAALEREDRERYLELARATTGEVMAEVFGEWRRAGSPCGGALVLWLRDLLPGAGWGVIDHRGVPKLAYHHLRRALSPVAVWTLDEGLNGVAIHAANDHPEPLIASLRVALYRGGELLIDQVTTPVELQPHSQEAWNVETLLGRFVDASWAYRFGPPAQDAIVVSLERDGARCADAGTDSARGDAGQGIDASLNDSSERDGELAAGSRTICQTVRFPAGRPLQRESPEQLGLRVRTSPLAGGEVGLRLHSRRLAYGVRIHAPGLAPSDDGFCIEPGGTREVKLQPCARVCEADVQSSLHRALLEGRITALNLDGWVELAGEDGSSAALTHTQVAGAAS